MSEYFGSKDSYPISVRLYNCIRTFIYPMDTMGEISRMTIQDFARLRGFGKVTMKEVERMFEFLGWELKSR